MPNFNRYFLRDVQKPLRSYSWQLLLAVEGILLLFVGAAFSFYWFLLQPFLQTGDLLSLSSPQLYLAIMWGISNALAFCYIWIELNQSLRMATKARRQKEQLGHFLFEVESELHDRLPEFLHDRWSNSEEPESENADLASIKYRDKYLSFRRRILLWELYDMYLDLKDKK